MHASFMSPDALIEKYIFMDTDIHVELKNGADALAKSFDDLWSYSPVVATLQEVRTFAPNDTLVELNAKRAACEPEQPAATSAVPADAVETAQTLDACKSAFVPPSFEQRLDREREKLAERVQVYQASYGAMTLEQRIQRYHPAIQRHIVGAQERGEVGRYTLVDAHPRIDYVENLPYLHASRVGGKGVPADVRERSRVWGTELTADTLDSKSIHRVWHHGFLNNCRGAHPKATVGPKRVILHQAYLAFSPDMLDVLGRMVDGALDCSNVTIDIITNSVKTTDLGIIDVVGKMFMAHLFNSFTNPKVVQLGSPNRAARLRLYEYKPLVSELTPNAPSLHSKVVVLDETTMWVGSANMDTRSITMDTNNGLLLRDVPQLVADFTRRFDRIEADPELVTFVADNGTPELVNGSYRRTGKQGLFYQQTVEQFQRTGWLAMYEKFVKPRKLDKAQEEKLEKRFHDILNRLYTLSERVIFGNVVEGTLQADAAAMQDLFVETTHF
jgi:cardiolipin synthase C